MKKTSLEDNPFVYLAILCDELQVWERKRNANAAYVTLPYSTYSDRFSLTIHNGFIRIYESDDNIEFEKKIAEYKKQINTKLKGASELVRLGIAEWK